MIPIAAILVSLIINVLPVTASADIVNEIRRFGELGRIDWKEGVIKPPCPRVFPKFVGAIITEEIDRLADTELAEWKRDVNRSLIFYGIDTTRYDHRNATLGDPYCELVIYSQGMKLYMESGESDPRMFSYRHEINYPILLGDRCLGEIGVALNEKCGRKLFEDEGDYFISGRTDPNHNLQQNYRNLCKVKKYTGLADEIVSLMRMWGGNLGNWYIQQTPSGKLIIIEDSDRGLWRRRPRVGNEKYYLE